MLEDETVSTVSLTSTDSSNVSRTEDDEVVILCEIVGARNLTQTDENDSSELDVNLMQPFCSVKYGGQLLHKTKPAEGLGTNPVWSISTNSLFLLKGTPKNMSRRMINISIWTKRQNTLRLMKNTSVFLGQVNLDLLTVLSHCDEKRLELNIEDELGEDTHALGTIALRFRLATPSDLKFMASFKKLEKKNALPFANREAETTIEDLFQSETSRPLAQLVTEKPEAEVVGSSLVNAFSYAFRSSRILDGKTGQRKVRVKPAPDPKRMKETQFMTKQDISLETRQPSDNWIEAGSGSLGKLYVEILSCHDLPNVDVGEAVGNVTDTFVCAVYEDACAMTDVIDDELSPHWLPWTQRAFCFGMMHPASILYLGVFDYDIGIGNHEAIGRVAVNVCNLQRDTVYTLRYDLYPSSNVTDRTPNGSITIRIRLECYDEKAALMAALKPRPKIHVNVQKEKSFKVVRYTCFGEYDNEEKFDLTVAKSYINEILEYKAALGYLFNDTMTSLIFWRGQVKVFSVLLPVHSFIFFCSAIALIENPTLIVPFTLLSVAWIMFANLTLRRQHPSPWNRCPSYFDYLSVLRTGVSAQTVRSIKEHENSKVTQSYEAAQKKRLDDDRMVAEKRAALQQEINEIGDDTISTKVDAGGLPLELLARLTRYQGFIGRYCRYFRFIRIIFTWEESIVSFWVTTVFLLAGLVSLFLPWGFILTWTSRIVVWGCFGPHMRLVEVMLRANHTENVQLKKIVDNFHIESKAARLRREDAVKLKDVKTVAFGRYSIQVPSFNLARHYDRPRPESSARVVRRGTRRLLGASKKISAADLQVKSPWIPGQQLQGAMIPRPEHAALRHEQEAEKDDDRLQLITGRVRELMESDGIVKCESLMQLTKLGVDPDLPPSLGYEVVPVILEEESEDLNEEAESIHTERISLIQRSHSVVMTGIGQDNENILVKGCEGCGLPKHILVEENEDDNDGLESVVVEDKLLMLPMSETCEKRNDEVTTRVPTSSQSSLRQICSDSASGSRDPNSTSSSDYSTHSCSSTDDDDDDDTSSIGNDDDDEIPADSEGVEIVALGRLKTFDAGDTIIQGTGQKSFDDATTTSLPISLSSPGRVHFEYFAPKC